MTSRKITEGRSVRYVSHGTPPREDGSQAHPSVSRPAFVTEVGTAGVVGLMVMNPTGLFWHPLASGGVPYDATGRLPGTWHWPDAEDQPAVFAMSSPKAGPDEEAA
ncbi:hypothetical protein ACFV42_23680 [Streptomyces solisilvae]|uniref:hypothetical protein n=1 Tax=Streptomyces malaysiensis TaxID=92644 RepID=UPI0036C078B6